ncbi:aldehyde dehydrogenase family protein [bacterium]|nr:aldehyde dehydrogenase family protein [bacterium]
MIQNSASPRCPDERLALVESLALCLTIQSADLASMIARDTGKPIRFCVAEVQRAVMMMRAVAARFHAYHDDERAGSARLRRRPIGRVSVITPANNPVYIPLSKLIPAMLYGNVAVWKPAEEVTSLSRRIMTCFAESNWPTNIVQLREGGHQAAEALMHEESVAGVTITGSEAAGRAAREICSRRNILLQAELGGNNAAVVWKDADLNWAAQAIADGAFEMAGQRCTANRRLIVHESVRDRFLDLVMSTSSRIKWGDPHSPDTQMGPLLSPSRSDRVAAVVGRASSHGSVLYPQNTNPPLSSFAGCWFPPTIVTCEVPEAEIVQEETFGPVLVVQTAMDWDHAIELTNGVRQGLVAAIFSSSPATIDRFLDQAQAGILKVNQATADAAVDVPFCAWKASGTGLPEHGIFNREFYTRPQTIYEAA